MGLGLGELREAGFVGGALGLGEPRGEGGAGLVGALLEARPDAEGAARDLRFEVGEVFVFAGGGLRDDEVVGGVATADEVAAMILVSCAGDAPAPESWARRWSRTSRSLQCSIKSDVESKPISSKAGARADQPGERASSQALIVVMVRVRVVLCGW